MGNGEKWKGMKIKIEDEGEKVKRQKVKGENAFITIYQLWTLYWQYFVNVFYEYNQ